MHFSQNGRRVVVIAILGIGGAVGLSSAADPPQATTTPPTAANPFKSFTTTTPDTPALTDKPASNPSRMVYEANWKNVQITQKPATFMQGVRPFIWTVKNTGATPVEFGDDYGFTLAPGEEEFIVDTRLVLQTKADQPATVDVKASRVMSQKELIQEPQPTPADVPPNVPTYSDDPFAPSKKKFVNPI